MLGRFCFGFFAFRSYSVCLFFIIWVFRMLLVLVVVFVYLICYVYVLGGRTFLVRVERDLYKL